MLKFNLASIQISSTIAITQPKPLRDNTVSTQFDEVVRISFKGSPYDLRELDSVTLAALSHFLTTVTALARTLLAMKDKAARFDEETRLVLNKADQNGSSISVSIRANENQHKIGPTKLALKDALHQVHSTYCAANRGEPIPSELPVELVASLAQIGEYLPPKVEMMIQLQKNKIASVTADVGEFLKLQRPESKNFGENTHKTDSADNSYEDLVDVIGKIYDVNVSSNIFKLINDDDSCTLDVNFNDELKSQITSALDQKNNVKLRILGTGILDELGNLQKIIRINSLETFQDNDSTRKKGMREFDQFVNQLVKKIPQSELDKLPADFAERHDDY